MRVRKQRHRSLLALAALVTAGLLFVGMRSAAADKSANSKTTKSKASELAAVVIPDRKPIGGEPDGIVQVANLVYAGVKSSQCFADHFLTQAEKDSAISTSRRFHAVKLRSSDVYGFPLLIMTGEGEFELADAERENLRRFIERGGFLLASAGCSSTEWNRSFRREMSLVFKDTRLEKLELSHSVFHTVYDIDRLEGGSGIPLEGITVGGRLGVIYSEDGLNDTKHTQGCCCCGGSELANAVKINVNILAYALTH